MQLFAVGGVIPLVYCYNERAVILLSERKLITRLLVARLFHFY